MSSRTVSVDGREVTITEFSGRKGARILRVLDHVGKEFPDIQREMQRYRKEYEESNTINMDRAFARAQYAPVVLMDEEPVLDDNGHVITDSTGQPLIKRSVRLGKDGNALLGPDPLGHMTEEDWAASGNKLRQPRSPSDMEVFLAVFPKILDAAETEIAKLLGLISMSNEDVRNYSREGKLWDVVAARGDELLDAPFDELAELLVASAEMVSDQYQLKIRSRLGERLTKALDLIGLGRLASQSESAGTNSTNSASTTSQTSSTDSLPPTDGTKSERSTAPVGVGSEASSSD